jgi:hypothetical protein
MSHLQNHSSSSVLYSLVNQLSADECTELVTSDEGQLIHALSISGGESANAGEVGDQAETHSDYESNEGDIADSHLIEDLFF